MNLAYEPSAELEELLGAMCESELSAAQARRLETIVESDDDACWHYLCYVHLHGTLHWNLGEGGLPNANRSATPLNAAPVAPAEESLPCTLPDAPIPDFLGNAVHGTVGYFSSSWPVAYLVATVIVLVGMAIGAVVHVSQPVQIATQPTLPSPLSSHPFIVGRITGMVDCRWEGRRKDEGGRMKDELPMAGNGIHPSSLLPHPSSSQSLVSLGDTFALSAGLMEITYDTGAKVILQGPCAYEVESPVSGFLSVGKLTARVDSKAESGKRKADSPLFAVRTPTATVTDLGTEFGVEVSKEGNTTSHVFRGSIEVQMVADGGKQIGPPVRLAENESVRVDRGTGGEHATMHRITADPSNFMRFEQLPQLVGELRLKSFRRWQTYSQELRRDPSLLAYYDFQQKKGEPAVLPNVAANNAGSFDGVVENATWTTGRVFGKQALRFRGPADYVRINLPQKVDELTLATWVRFDWLNDRSASALVMSTGWTQPGQICWQVDNKDGCMLFDSITGASNVARSASVIGQDLNIRQWIHLASVLDRATARVRFYVDGRSVGESDYQANAPIIIGPASIGNWDTETYQDVDGARNFLGRMDEFAIFGRTLAAGEVQRMYEEGKP